MGIFDFFWRGKSIIPRALALQDVVGFVYCRDLGLLACGCRADKRRLWAWAEIFRTAMERGAFEVSIKGSFPTAVAGVATTEERDAFDVLSEHQMENYEMVGQMFGERGLATRLDRLGKKVRKDICYLSREECLRLLK